MHPSDSNNNHIFSDLMYLFLWNDKILFIIHMNAFILVGHVPLPLQESEDMEASEPAGLRRRRTIKKKKRVSCSCSHLKKTQQPSIFLYPSCCRLLRTFYCLLLSLSSVIFQMDKSLISRLILQGRVIPSQKDSFKNAQVWSGTCWSPLITSYLSICFLSFTVSQQASSCYF